MLASGDGQCGQGRCGGVKRPADLDTPEPPTRAYRRIVLRVSLAVRICADGGRARPRGLGTRLKAQPVNAKTLD
jgi:hypothetical protein